MHTKIKGHLRSSKVEKNVVVCEVEVQLQSNLVHRSNLYNLCYNVKGYALRSKANRGLHQSQRPVRGQKLKVNLI